MNATTLDRTPEPELMDQPAQVEAYAAADFTSSNQWFVDDLVERFRPRPACGRLIDLGCGPADICIRLARALPEWKIHGLDAGPNMLRSARAAIAMAGLDQRIELHLAQLPETDLEPQSFACVTSNSLLHHLPEPMVLWRAVRKLAAPGAWVQVMDLDRPDSAEAVDQLVQDGAGSEPEVLRRDFRNSLHAAWRVEEVREQLHRAGLDLGCRRVSDRHWLVSGQLD